MYVQAWMLPEADRQALVPQVSDKLGQARHMLKEVRDCVRYATCVRESGFKQGRCVYTACDPAILPSLNGSQDYMSYSMVHLATTPQNGSHR